MVKRHRKREKRFRPEKIISEREFLTGEHRTKEDLPTELHVLRRPRNKRKMESNAPKVDGQTRVYLGSGKRPKWMDCEEVEEDA